MRINPSNVNAVYVAGLCSYYVGDLSESLKHFTKILALDPNHNGAQTMQLKVNIFNEKFEKADKLFYARKFKEACELYTEMLKIDPQNVKINSELYCRRANVHKFMKKFQECSNDYEDALRLNRTSEIEQALAETQSACKRYCQ